MKFKIFHFASLLLAVLILVMPFLLGLKPAGNVPTENLLYEPSEALLFAILDADDFDPPVEVMSDDGIISYQVGTVDGKPVGAVFVLSVTGWNPGMLFIVGVENNGEISGVEIIQHMETPGIGESIETIQFRVQFLGNTFDMEFLSSGTAGDNQVAAMAGATVSSQAIFDGAKASVQYYVESILPTWE